MLPLEVGGEKRKETRKSIIIYSTIITAIENINYEVDYNFLIIQIVSYLLIAHCI